MQRLLVIDDEPGIRFSIEQVFEQAGIEVFTADCAEEGLHVASEKMPDVILLDIRLGRCSGLELFHELRRADPDARSSSSPVTALPTPLTRLRTWGPMTTWSNRSMPSSSSTSCIEPWPRPMRCPHQR